MTTTAPTPPPVAGQPFEVELPSGGKLYVQSPEEVELWEKSREKYLDDYHLTKQNDLILVGAILQQQLIMFRSQRMANGMMPEMDANSLPTGRYTMKQVESEDIAAAMKMLNQATGEVTRLEKALGIDKVSRESGGQHTLSQYLQMLKGAAHARAIHISKRVIAYETFFNELSWRCRALKNWDAEDRAYHKLTPETVIAWATEEIDKLHDLDKKFAHEKGKLVVGKL